MRTTEKPLTTIDSYIKSAPENARSILEKIRKIIRAAAPGATETIGYGIPTFKLGGKNLIHFGGWAEHVGLYPTPGAITAFKKELTRYKQAKGSVQFPLNEEIPYDLIKKITLFRVQEVKKLTA